MNEPLLLIPGPTNVAPEIAAAATAPMIGHRGPEIRELVGDILPRLQSLLGTESPVFPLPGSATSTMEAAVRNAAPGPFLHLVNGAFSGRWSKAREACGLPGDEYAVDWGQAHDPDELRRRLGERRYAAVTLVHSETSTGVLNPLPALARVVREHSDALLLVDTVSSMTAVELSLDEWGVDVCFAGSQKAWALPPGLVVCVVSTRAIGRAADAPGRGWALDWVENASRLEDHMTPTTPPISLMQQLQEQLRRIEREGATARYARHTALQAQVLEWAGERFAPFAAAGHRSPTVTPLRAEGFVPTELVAALRPRGIVLGTGYGKTKAELFRIGHMGELDSSRLAWALGQLDECIAEAREGRA